jgi:predicted small secreted protein
MAMKTFFKLPLLLAVMSLSLVACNQDDFFEKDISNLESIPQEELRNICLQAETLNDCQRLSQICQPAYDEKDNQFSACVPLVDPRIVDINDPITKPGVDPVVNPAPIPEAPGAISVPVAISIGCENLHPRYLAQKHGGQPKVLICQNVRNNPHNITVACPALKAHIGKLDNYVGPCLQD